MWTVGLLDPDDWQAQWIGYDSEPRDSDGEKVRARALNFDNCWWVWFGEGESGVQLDQVRPIDDVPIIHPRAILFIHGEQDDLVRVENSLSLYDAALEPKELYLIPNAGHGGLYEADPEKFGEVTLTFLQQYLLNERR